MIGFGITLPVLLFFVERLALAEGASRESVALQVGLLTGAYPLMQLLFAPVWGRWSDRVGTKSLVIIAVAGYVVAPVFFGIVTPLWLPYVARVLAGKQPALQYLSMDAAVKHCSEGIGISVWASNDQGKEPDVVMACAGDVPTMETLAAVDILRQNFSELKIRVVNVVDLMTLQPQSEHPHGLSDKEFDILFTTDKPIIFVFHGYPWLIHRLTYRRTNHRNLHVRGHKEEGTTTTPFDMCVLNDLDRFHLVMDVIERVPKLTAIGAHVLQAMRDKLIDHKEFIVEHGEDMPEVRDWKSSY